jgi:hypothetical protein
MTHERRDADIEDPPFLKLFFERDDQNTNRYEDKVRGRPPVSWRHRVIAWQFSALVAAILCRAGNEIPDVRWNLKSGEGIDELELKNNDRIRIGDSTLIAALEIRYEDSGYRTTLRRSKEQKLAKKKTPQRMSDGGLTIV